MLLSDSSDKSTSLYRSSNSSSSSSKSSRQPRSSPQVVRRSPPHRRQPLYSATRKSNSPTQNDNPSSSATSSSSAPTISTNNNNIPEQVGENNEDLAIFSKSREGFHPRFLTPTKRQRMNSLIAQHVRLISLTQQSSLKILDSGTGISGVGEQWKMTDISASSEVTIQGAFGDPMKPTVQGLLGPDKLPAVLVPGMQDDIYSLCQRLQPNKRTGTTERSYLDDI